MTAIATYKVHAIYDKEADWFVISIPYLNVDSRFCEHILEIPDTVREMIYEVDSDLDYNNIEIDLPKEIEFEVRVTD